MRTVLIILGVVVLLAVGAGVYLAVNLNSIVKSGIETVGPDVLGVNVTVESVNLSLLSGEGELQGLAIGNPEGFVAGDAIRVGQVRVAVDTATVTGDPIVIREITVRDAEVLAQLTARGDTNLQAIMRNIDSGEPAAESAEPGPQIIIDRVAISGTRAVVVSEMLGEVGVTVPDINLTDVGRDSGGATAADAAQQILRPVVAAIVRSVTEGQIRSMLENTGSRLGEELEKQSGGLMDRLKGLSPFQRQEE